MLCKPPTARQVVGQMNSNNLSHQIVLKFEVVNLDAITSPGAGDSAYVPTLNLTLPPKVKFNRRVSSARSTELPSSLVIFSPSELHSSTSLVNISLIV